tara:strand:+ start:60 stop:524 length:465 start_codon:yes stop_codon:yes gene_type:complete
MESETNEDNLVELLENEFIKLQKIIQSSSQHSEKKISDIVSLYYQATMVKTLSKKIKSDLTDEPKSENQSMLNKIDKIQKDMSKNFSQSIHPEILAYLTNSIQISTENLKSLGQNPEQKTKQTIENEAKSYKELRELMSTKEFVTQYEIGLKDD